MDARLKPTKKQNALIEQMEELIDKMRKSHLEFLLDDDGFLRFYNGKQVCDIHWPENTTGEMYKMDIGELYSLELGAVKIGYDDEFMGIEFND